MEKLANSTKPLFTFSAIPHRHLKSDTYNTFVNIFSHIYQQGERVIEVGESSSRPSEAVSERDSALERIEEILGVEEISGLLERDGVFCNDDVREKKAMAEFECIIKGNGELKDGDRVDIVKNCVGEINVETCADANALLLEKKDSCENGSEAVDFDFDFDLCNSVINGVLEIGMLEVENVRGVDDLGCNVGKLSSVDRMIEEGEVEEGELFGDLMVVDETAVKSPVFKEKEDGMIPVSALLETNVGARNGTMELGKGLSEEVVRQPGSIVVDFKSADEANLNIPELEHGRKGERVADANGRGDDLSSRRGNLVFYGDIMDSKLSKNQEKKSTKEQDAGVGNKKKRGGLSEESKAKKKAKKRKKRAEKNRQLGVKRLKLPAPVMKPKTVSYCRHYMKGRCQEGEKCKFSHDTIPLTKSTPCCYFARHSCMKGDDCPFDHQLSKYPCNNFVTKGSCSRGDECMFSHKMALTDNSAANLGVGDSELKTSSLLVNSNSKQLNGSKRSSQNSKGLLPSKETPCKKLGEKVAETPLKPSVLAFKGTGAFPGDNTPSVYTSKLKQCDTSKSKNDARIQNQIGERVTTGLNLMSTPNKTTMASRGINFLSFGKTLQENTDNSPSSKNSNLQKQASTSSNTDESNRVGNSSGQRLSDRIEDSSERLKISKPSASPSGINFLSFGKVSSDGVSKQSNSTFSFRTGAERPSQESSTSSRPSEFSSFPWKLSGSRLLSSQHNTGHTKEKPNSAQKALFSTLAFAAKFEAQLKMKSANDALGGETSKPHNHQVP